MVMAEEEGLEVGDDAGGMEEGEGEGGQRRLSEELGSPGGGGAEETLSLTAEDLLLECVVCGKRFQSAKAVDGHMKVRVCGQRECVEEEDKSRELTPNLSDGKNSSHECRVCGKTFPSRKSLYGHMRTHPDRTWRGVHPPPDEGLFSGWSVTGRRGRRIDDSVSYGLDSASEDALRDKEFLKLSLSLPDEKASIEMPQQEEKPSLDVSEIKNAEEAGSKNSPPGLDLDRESPANKYTCSRCHKSFSKYQSLGGHRSSCNKSEQCHTTYQAPALPRLKPSWLDLSLSLSPPDYPPSNLGEAESGGRMTMGFDLNVSVQNPTDRVPLELDMISF